MFTKILHRPALAIVISIILLFLGGLGIMTLPIAQFPDIAPPTVQVSIAYPGASANVLVDSVLIPLEQSINGVQNMRYMVVRRHQRRRGGDPDLLRAGHGPEHQRRERAEPGQHHAEPAPAAGGARGHPRQPGRAEHADVREHLTARTRSADQKYLFNFTNVNVMPVLKRIQGMGIPRNLGNRTFAMRIWLNPDRMRAYKISTEDVMKAAGGTEHDRFARPARPGHGHDVAVERIRPDLRRAGSTRRSSTRTSSCGQPRGRDPAAQGRLRPPKGRSASAGGHPAALAGTGTVPRGRARDPAKAERHGIELGSEFFDIYSDINGHPAASIILKQSPGSNAAEVIEEIKKELEQIKKESFPPGMDYELAYDVSNFLDASIEKVLHTLLEAFILVSLVVYMFLGDLRSTLIPILAVPVSLIGTFFVLQLMGLSINLITLFAMVLAIGVVVDDAIVVVEAVHAKMPEKHLSPYRATMEVLHEISGAIIAITLVMTAVFVPVTFIPGPVGTFYRQFGITMATSIILSGLVALTLTPVLCAMILKPHAHAEHADARVSRLKDLFGLAFEYRRRAAAAGTYVDPLWWRRLAVRPAAASCRSRSTGPSRGSRAGMPRSCGGSSPAALLTLAVVGGFAAGIVVVNTSLPTGFIPGEDQGIIYAVLQTPPGSTLEYTNAKSHELEEIAKEIEGSHLRHLAGRLRGADRGPRLERGDLHHQPEKLVRPQADRAADHRGTRRRSAARCPTSSSSSSSRPRSPASARPAGSPCVVLDKTNSRPTTSGSGR